MNTLTALLEDLQRLQSAEKELLQLQDRARRIIRLYLPDEIQIGQRFTSVCFDKLEELLVEKLKKSNDPLQKL